MPKKKIFDEAFYDFDVELRESQQDGVGDTLVGYAIKWGAISEDVGGFRERFQKGAFSEVLKDADAIDVVSIFNHEKSSVLGRTPNSLRLEEDEIGLRYEVDLDDTTVANDLRKQVRRGDVRGSSFGFKVRRGGDKYEMTPDGVLRTVLPGGVEKLRDVSPVTFPAYSASDVTLRSLEEWLEEREESEEEEAAKAEEQDAALTEAESRDRKLQIADVA